jgi:hypothetical protein
MDEFELEELNGLLDTLLDAHFDLELLDRGGPRQLSFRPKYLSDYETARSALIVFVQDLLSNHQREAMISREIDAVEIAGPSVVRIRWRHSSRIDVVDLTGWIETGAEILTPLKTAAMFEQARVAANGEAVIWNDGDLAIDATLLRKLADEQRSAPR